MKRRLPLIFVAIVTLICLVAASVAAVASGASGSAVAYQVNDTKVSQASVDRDLAEIANHEAVNKVETVFGIPVRATNGGISSTFAATWLTAKIRQELFRQAADGAKVSVDDAARAAQGRALDQQFQTNNVNVRVSQLPPVVRDTLLDYFAYPKALGIDTQAKLNSFFADAAKHASIRVDPRYGRWNRSTLSVCPPTGCVPTTASGG